MRWILGLVGALAGSIIGDETGLALGAGLGLLIGWIIEREQLRHEQLRRPTRFAANLGEGQSFEERATKRILELTRRVETLERTVVALQRSVAEPAPSGTELPKELGAIAEYDDRGVLLNGPPPEPPASPEHAPQTPAVRGNWREHWEEQEEQARAEEHATEEAGADATHADAIRSQKPTHEEGRRSPASGEAARNALHEFLFGGNTVVRVGILVLTVGVGLLVKYAADQAYFPLELRLAFAAALALALVVVGYLQRSARATFASALQGGGVAAMYLVTFFSYYSYQLLPPTLTLALLIAIAALSSVLALLQNAQQLAVFGAIGGFLSPVLASHGGGSHIQLFAYYALLDLAILGMALFRSWRILNWTGFAFTFGIASAWGALQYKPENLWSATFFLALFFVIYVIDATAFALRHERRGTVDTTLTFGTPLATLALAGGLFLEQPLFLALACVFIASVYVGFARALVTTRDAALLTLSRAYVAVGVGAATLAIPFALDDALATALAWAVEACGLTWVGIRQQRLRTRVAGYLLFGASLFALVSRVDAASGSARALFCALIALAFMGAAAFVERGELSKEERYVGLVLFGLGLLNWAAACIAFNESLLLLAYRPLAWFGEIAGTTVLLELAGAQFRFRGARYASTLTFPLLLASALAFLDEPQAAVAMTWLGRVLAIAAGIFALRRNDASLREHPLRADLTHASALWAVALMTLGELASLLDRFQLADGFRYGGVVLAPALIAIVAVNAKPEWPLHAYARGYLRWAAWPLVLVTGLFALISQGATDGAALPLPYLPLLNPFDLATAILVVLIAWISRSPAVRGPINARVGAIGAALLSFAALNGTVVRAAHHWAGIPFIAWDVPTAPVVQASFSILWSALALIAMLGAQRLKSRTVWLTGAALLAGVVVKLFLLDLSNLSAGVKIITFLAVGLLLLLIGYFAPVPPSEARANASLPSAPEPSPEKSE